MFNGILTAHHLTEASCYTIQVVTNIFSVSEYHLKYLTVFSQTIPFGYTYSVASFGKHYFYSVNVANTVTV